MAEFPQTENRNGISETNDRIIVGCLYTVGHRVILVYWWYFELNFIFIFSVFTLIFVKVLVILLCFLNYYFFLLFVLR